MGLAGALALAALPLTVSALPVELQNATAQLSQGGFPVTATIDNIYSFADAGGAGWANNSGGDNVAVFETVNNVDGSPSQTLRFNIFAGGFTNHTVGRYRISYTTDDRSTFADGAINGGDVTANWTALKPLEAISSGGATLNIVGNDIVASGTNPNRATDTIYAQASTLAPITGIRIETLEDPSFPSNGPGRAANGNFVLREFDVASFNGERVVLTNGTAQLSQGGFSVDNVIDGAFNFESTGGVGWADVGGGSTGNTNSNIATFETAKDIGRSATTELTAEIFSGGFGRHTIGKFRISATTADRSLFANGNDNGGAGVGNEAGIWQILNPLEALSDSAGRTLTIDSLTGIVLISGGSPEFELTTLRFLTELQGITGFRLEVLEDGSLPFDGPGFGPGNGNFVLRDFSIFASVVPEPASMLLLVMGGAALARRRQRAHLA